MPNNKNNNKPKGQKKRAQRAPQRKQKSRGPSRRVVKARPVGKSHPLVGNGTSTQPDVRQYHLALTNPFHPGSVGARVPDSFVIPTVTYHVRSAILCNSNVSGTFSCAIYPSPCLSMTVALGTVSGGVTSFAANTSSYYIANPNTVSSVLTAYRVVSWGVRIVPKDTMFAAKGKFYIAVVPTTANAPSFNTLNTVTATDNDVIGEYLVGMGLQTGGMAQIVNQPSVRAFSAADLLRKEIQLAGVPVSPSFYEFKGTMDRHVPWNTNQNLADEAVFDTTTKLLVNATTAGRKDPGSIRGGCAFLLYATGLPPSTQEFDLELVYHLEGEPNLGAIPTGGSLVPSSMRVLHGSTSLVEQALSAAHTAGKVISMVNDPVGSAIRGIAAAGKTGRGPLMLTAR